MIFPNESPLIKVLTVYPAQSFRDIVVLFYIVSAVRDNIFVNRQRIKQDLVYRLGHIGCHMQDGYNPYGLYTSLLGVIDGCQHQSQRALCANGQNIIIHLPYLSATRSQGISRLVFTENHIRVERIWHPFCIHLPKQDQNGPITGQFGYMTSFHEWNIAELHVKCEFEIPQYCPDVTSCQIHKVHPWEQIESGRSD